MNTKENIADQIQTLSLKVKLVDGQIQSTVIPQLSRCEKEMGKYLLLRDGFRIAISVLNQRKAEDSEADKKADAYLGALDHLGNLANQAEILASKSEGSYEAFRLLLGVLREQRQTDFNTIEELEKSLTSPPTFSEDSHGKPTEQS